MLNLSGTIFPSPKQVGFWVPVSVRVYAAIQNPLVCTHVFFPGTLSYAMGLGAA